MLLLEIVVLGTMCHIMHTFQKKFGVVLVLAVILIAALWACSPLLLGLLADHYYAQANQADDTEVAGLIDRLVSLGAPAIPRLTSALGSERKVVAQTVRTRLIKMIETWEHPDTRPSSRARLTLAGSLATRMEQYGPTARLHATTLARQMLRASTGGMTSRESRQLTLTCETILNISKAMAKKDSLLEREEETLGSSIAKRALEKGSSGSDFLHTTFSTRYSGDEPLSEQSLVDLARLPGGALPPALPELSSHRLTPEEGGGRQTVPLIRSAANPKALKPFTLSDPKSSDDSRVGSSPRELASQADSSSDENPIREPDSDPRRLPDDPSVRSLESVSDGKMAATSPRYASRSPSKKPSDRVYSLMMQLHAGDPKKAEQARRELIEGGFKTVHFALAERMTDPDSAVRKELVQVLPRLKSVQAKQWLKWLLKDDDSSVRREALATLASSNDPQLLAEIAEIAQSDDDPKIRLEGERIESRLTK